MFYPILVAVAVAGLVPVACLAFQLWSEQKQRRAAALDPFTDPLPRPPGEHLRSVIRDLEFRYESAVANLLILCLSVTIFAVFASAIASKSTGNSGSLAIAGVMVVFGVFISWRRGPELRNLLVKLDNHRLGFEGERRVGAVLNTLERDGYTVYHDLALEPKAGLIFNIDHIVVGPAGIFAVETKTRSKKCHVQGRFEITPRAGILEFSDGYRGRDHLDEARNRARDLERWIANHLENLGPVQAILTYPGWWVNQGDGDVTVAVINPKQIPKHILALEPTAAAPTLDPGRVAALRNLLATECVA